MNHITPYQYPPGYQRIAGVDEAGRGPLVGAVVSAAVILDPQRPIAGLADSKQLSEAKREKLAEQIKQQALAWATGQASAAEIDQINILQATMLAMQRALAALAIVPDCVLIDGNCCPSLPMPALAVVKGDSRVAEISAASILAKVARDQQMYQLHHLYPHYGFASHKGYPTAQHLAMLARYGAMAEHRRSFAPVRRVLQHQDSSTDRGQ